MQAFVARQPIFDRQLDVYGYELLFRSSLENVFTADDQDQATSKLINDSMSLMNMEELTGNHKGFINFTQQTLVQEIPKLLPKEWLVVELLEFIQPDNEFITIIRSLKDSGYLIALDDFVDKPKLQPLLELADIIKVDFMQSGPDERTTLINKMSGKNVTFLAEKLEDQDEFQAAMDEGFELFQGYFFAKPAIISKKDIPTAKMQSFRLLKEVYRAELDYEKLNTMIRQEVSLTYRLLRYINSPFFGVRSKVNSVKQALALLGEDNTRRWISLVALANISAQGPRELVAASLFRAVFCECLAELSGLKKRKLNLFLTGLLSLVDAMLARPKEELLAQLPLDRDITSALIDQEGPLAAPLKLVLAYEQGDWEQTVGLALDMGINEKALPDCFLKATQAVNEILPASGF